LEQKDFTEALRSCKQALEICPDSDEAEALKEKIEREEEEEQEAQRQDDI